MAAWGNENNYYYKYDDWGYSQGDMNHIGNQLMLLEHGMNTVSREEQHIEVHSINSDKVTGSFDPLRNTKQQRLIVIHNKYNALSDDNDEDNSGDKS